jgi:glutaredoxin
MCRRERAAPAEAPAPAAAPPPARGQALLLVTAIAAFAAGGGLWATRTPPPAPIEASVRAPPPQPGPASPAPEPARTDLRHTPADEIDAALLRRQASVEQPVIVAKAAEPPPPAPAIAASGAAAADAARRRERDLKVAMERVNVTVYSTTWCGVCKRAKSWLSANGIAYSDRDVEASDDARREQLAKNPKGGVPTIDVDGDVMVGFGPSHMQEMLRTAAERRARRF